MCHMLLVRMGKKGPPHHDHTTTAGKIEAGGYTQQSHRLPPPAGKMNGCAESKASRLIGATPICSTAAATTRKTAGRELAFTNSNFSSAHGDGGMSMMNFPTVHFTTTRSSYTLHTHTKSGVVPCALVLPVLKQENELLFQSAKLTDTQR